MNQQEAQDILSRLYADRPFREQFFADRNSFYGSRPVTDPELRAFLDELKKEQVDFFAKSLLAKRRHAVFGLLAGTVFLLGQNAAERFNEFAQTFLPSGIHKHHADAIAFCSYLLKQENAFAALNDQVRFEQKQLENFISGKRWSLLRCRYNVIGFQRDLLAGKKDVQMEERSTTILWRKGRIIRVF